MIEKLMQHTLNCLIPMVFLAYYTKNSKFYLNKWGGEQKFIKNSLESDTKMSLVNIKK